MGCVSSKTDINDLHPNIFQVMNVDEMGHKLSPGQLEITETDLVFYQKGKTPVRWPLKCLRRYGFDAELFSFESGRRCPTGPGIYAFRCRRAEQLFNLLQGHIQNRNGEDAVSREFPIGGTGNHIPTSASRTGFSSNVGSIAGGDGVDNGNYLEPVRSRNSNLRNLSQTGEGNNIGLSNMRNSGSSGPLGSPNSISPPLTFPTIPIPPTTASSNSAYYINEDIFSDGDTNSVTSNSRRTVHQYVNSATSPTDTTSPVQVSIGNGVVNSDTNSKPAEGPISYMNLGPTSPVSPYDINTNYAKLDDLIKSDEEAHLHLYMNVVPENAKDTSPKIFRDHYYANLEPGEIEVKNTHHRPKLHSPLEKDAEKPLLRNQVHNITNQVQTQGVSQGIVNQTPIRQVNYIVLDLDRGSDSNNSQTLPTSPIGSLSSCPESPRRASEGYATIDFDKTVALSHSVNPKIDNDTEGSRKTRHNSTINEATVVRNSSSLSD